ncbi:MAG: hypothetical protein ABI562_06585 [Chloroflexota bacterium]
MIVVIGSPIGRLVDGATFAGGMAARVALAAASSGRTVQLVGRTGDDAIADAVVLDLAGGGVGHVALLRDPARATPVEVGTEEGEADAAGTLDGDEADAETDAVSQGEGPVATPGPALEPADVDLGLRYLTDFKVVVLAEPSDPATIAIVADAVRWADARLVLVLGAGKRMPDGLPDDAVVFEAPTDDPDGAFATLVGTFTAAVDGGTDPGPAFRASIASDGWTEAAETEGV